MNVILLMIFILVGCLILCAWRSPNSLDAIAIYSFARAHALREFRRNYLLSKDREKYFRENVNRASETGHEKNKEEWRKEIEEHGKKSNRV